MADWRASRRGTDLFHHGDTEARRKLGNEAHSSRKAGAQARGTHVSANERREPGAPCQEYGRTCRASLRPDSRGRLSPRVQWRGRRYLRDGGRFLLQFLGLVVGDERVDDGLEFAVHYVGELVDRETDTVVGDAVLREVVGADLLAAVAGADHGFAFFGQSFLLLLHLDFIEARTQDPHALLAVLDLRFFVLAADDRVGWDVRDAHGGIGRVHRLPARARRAERIDAQIFGLDLDVDVFSLGEHGDSNGRGMHAALLFRGGHALDAVDAAFVLELRIDALAFDDGDHFFEAADGGFGGREHLHFPALRFSVARVHAEHFVGEERGLITAGASADFEDDVLFVVGIFGEEQDLQIGFDLADARFELSKLFLRVGAHVGVFFVGEDGFAFGDAASEVFVLAILLDDVG